MAPTLLNIVYLTILAVTSPWLLFQAVRRGKYREGFAAKFLGAVPQRLSNRPCIWFHAVSVGEVNLLGVLLKEIARRQPNVECVVSATTMTGYSLAKQKYSHCTVFYCPLDFSWAVRRAMRRIRPSVLALAELELWPNLIMAAKECGARVAIVNGRLSQRSFRGYLRIRRLLRSTLAQIDLIAAQNDEYAGRFRKLGIASDRVHTTGSLKFDGATADRENPMTQRLAALAAFSKEDIVFLAGSTQSPEEQLALDAFKSLAAEHSNLKLVIVPRHPHRFDEVAALFDRNGLAWQRRSQLKSMGNGEWGMGNASRPSPLAPRLSPRILLVDTVGELGAGGARPPSASLAAVCSPVAAGKT